MYCHDGYDKKISRRIGIDLVENTEEDYRTSFLKTGIELYDQTIVKNLEPSFKRLVKVLDGRVSRNDVSRILDDLEDKGYIRISPKTKNQPALTSEGRYFFEPIYNKVMISRTAD